MKKMVKNVSVEIKKIILKRNEIILNNIYKSSDLCGFIMQFKIVLYISKRIYFY